MWRKPRNEESKDRLTSGNWRERRLSPESGEAERISGNWRARKQKEAAEVNTPKVYGGSMPPGWKLVGMYKQLKADNAKLTTWLVESVYPSPESLPFYITLSDTQAERERGTDPSGGGHRGRLLPSTTDYSKYKIIVNKFTELARQSRKVPPSILTLLDRLIEERAEYTYWMSQKSTDDTCRTATESHLYYIEVLKETKNHPSQAYGARSNRVTSHEPNHQTLSN